MTNAARAEKWIAGVEKGVGRALERAARSRPFAIEAEAAPFLATFKRQAAGHAVRAQTLASQGDRAGALVEAGHAQRCAANHAKILEAVDSVLTSC